MASAQNRVSIVFAREKYHSACRRDTGGRTRESRVAAVIFADISRAIARLFPQTNRVSARALSDERSATIKQIERKKTEANFSHEIIPDIR